MSDSESESGEVLDPAEWVTSYGDDLYRYAWSRLRDQQMAEEVVQETFLAGIKFLDQFSGEGTQRGWLMGILKRKIIDQVRRRARVSRDSASGIPIDDEMFEKNGFWKHSATTWSSIPDDSVEASELWDIVKQCLEHLPGSLGDAFVLSVMEEMSSDDVCKELEISPSNFWVRMHRARLGLSRCVGARWGHSG